MFSLLRISGHSASIFPSFLCQRLLHFFSFSCLSPALTRRKNSAYLSCHVKSRFVIESESNVPRMPLHERIAIAGSCRLMVSFIIRSALLLVLRCIYAPWEFIIEPRHSNLSSLHCTTRQSLFISCPRASMPSFNALITV